MYCNNCGAKNPDGSNFCSACGSKMAAPQERSVEQDDELHPEVYDELPDNEPEPEVHTVEIYRESTLFGSTTPITVSYTAQKGKKHFAISPGQTYEVYLSTGEYSFTFSGSFSKRVVTVLVDRGINIRLKTGMTGSITAEIE